ncbi:keratinocyte-associated protein 3-like isoform X1 [Denticeps clupeoides]|uniref:Keratinocyte-associated protein 3 n=1 Tax=Denticeps clupeoides TaxID=299321 RepID=A0AAY4AE82_9TELE|nr:keratinocyte-associated protein 3-like isoform X1 [Denticeps clupeoides]
MCGFDRQKGPGRLMKKGITLILVGHINFILGAIVHGSILRHISKPNREITTEYTATNIISVTSGLLSIVSGIVAILVSRNLSVQKLHICLLISSFLNALLSAACAVGLLLAISLTIAADGDVLMKGCNSTGVPISARSPVSVDCPFDSTRIFDTTLALWFPCVLLASVEAGLSIWCFLVGLTLRGIGPYAETYVREQVRSVRISTKRRYCQKSSNLCLAVRGRRGSGHKEETRLGLLSSRRTCVVSEERQVGVDPIVRTVVVFRKG